jgi:hypothetical protein
MVRSIVRNPALSRDYRGVARRSPDSEARRETPHPSVDVEVGYPQKPPLQVSLESEQEKPAQQRCPFPPQGLQKPPRHSALDVQELFPQQG